MHNLIGAMGCAGPYTGKHTQELGLGSHQMKLLCRSLRMNCYCQNPKHEESMSPCEFRRDFTMLGTASLAAIQTCWTFKSAWAGPSEHVPHCGPGMGGMLGWASPFVSPLNPDTEKNKINITVEIMVLPTFLQPLTTFTIINYYDYQNKNKFLNQILCYIVPR